MPQESLIGVTPPTSPLGPQVPFLVTPPPQVAPAVLGRAPLPLVVPSAPVDLGAWLQQPSVWGLSRGALIAGAFGVGIFVGRL